MPRTFGTRRQEAITPDAGDFFAAINQRINLLLGRHGGLSRLFDGARLTCRSVPDG
jgi:hypothetical protein